MSISPYDLEEFARIGSLIAENIGKVASNIGRLAQAIENANQIAAKHNQWERHE